MATTKLRGDLAVLDGDLAVLGGWCDFNNVQATTLSAFSWVAGALRPGSMSMSTDTDLNTAAQKYAVYPIEATAASKTLTLRLSQDAAAFVVNTGSTNAFTLKNVPGDSGVSVAVGKVYLVIGGGSTANTAKFILLNDGAGT